MSSKKKKAAGSCSWVQCDDCNAIFNEKDVACHKLDCPPSKKTYPYVASNAVHCTLDIHNDKDAFFQHVPAEEFDYLICLSNASLQLCGIPNGDPVAVSDGSGVTYVRRAWKGHDRQLISASLSENDVLVAKTTQVKDVVVRPLTDRVHAAREIVVEPLNDATDNSESMAHVKQSCTNRIFCVGNTIGVSFYGRKTLFKIAEILGFGDDARSIFHKAVSETWWRLNEIQTDFSEDILLDQIGGLHSVLDELTETLSLTLGAASGSEFLKARGIILHGPSGTGKSLLMKAMAQKWATTVVNVSSSGWNPRLDGDVERHLEQCFLRAQRGVNSVITIDDLDVFCGKPSSSSGQESQMASALAALFDRLHCAKSRIVVIATTNNVNQVDRCLRRPGRFDKELEVGVPTPQERLQILQALLRKSQNNEVIEGLKSVADNTHGYVGADLVALLSKAVTMATKEGSRLLASHLLRCLPHVRPSAMREIMVQVPNVRWEDIGGQEQLKHQLRQAVEWPLKHPDSFRRLGVCPPRGVLMYGPPGCSKTMVAKALATESGLNFISVKGPELFSKWVGESEKAVREVFRRARQAAPSIVFFDELDALAGERSAAAGGAQVQERVLAQLLTELDGVEALGHVIVVGATNRPDRIDPALLRPGRLDRVVHVPLPDTSTRSDIFRIQFRKTPVSGDVSPSELAELTAGYSGAEVVAVCNEAAMAALDENIDADTVSRSNFLMALKLVTPRTPASALLLCEKYKNLSIK